MRYSEASQAGNLFTFFLHDPLTAFCFTVTRMVLTQETYNQCTEALNNLLIELQNLVTTSPEMRMLNFHFIELHSKVYLCTTSL